MSKEKDLNDIKKISSIKVKTICDELNVDDCNLYKLKVSEEKTKLVKEEFVSRLKKCIEEIEKGQSKVDMLFELYKESSLGNSEKFRKEITSKYNISDEEFTELYRRIVNYQVEKYGETLRGDWIIHEDYDKTRERAKQRRIDRVKRRGLK